jgi:hypothetical protein
MKELYGDAILPFLKEVGYRYEIIFDKAIKLKNAKTYVKPIKKIKKVIDLASYLQNIEADIFINTAVKLIKDGIKVITKHDSLIFDMKYIDVVFDEIKKGYKRVLNVEIKKHHLHINKYYNERNTIPFSKTLNKKDITIKIDVKQEMKERKSEIQTTVQQYVNHSEKQKKINHAEIKKKTGKTDLTVYTFINKRSGETFTGIKSEFAKRYKIDRSTLNKVIKGVRKSIKGWTVFKKA